MKNDTNELLSKLELTAHIGKRIKEIRVNKNISQAELARLCYKDRQHIEMIENSKVSPSIYTLYIISTALKISLSELLDIELPHQTSADPS